MVASKEETWVTIPEDQLGAAGLNFGDKAIRRGFIRKVYSILSLQLLVTVAAIGYCVLLLPYHYHHPNCPQFRGNNDMLDQHGGSGSSNILDHNNSDVDNIEFECNKK